MIPPAVRFTALILLFGAATASLPAQRAGSTRTGTATATAAPGVAPADLASERPDRADLDVIVRLKDEGWQRSAVMETAWYLTDIYGPRLTNSPGMRAAADWAITRLTEWGLSNVHKEAWGPFGRGWVNERLIVNEVAPAARPLLAYPVAWTPGTNGLVSSDAILVTLDREEDFARWQGKLAGKIVLPATPIDVRPLMTPPGRRYTDQELLDLQQQPIPPSPSISAPLPPPAPLPPQPPFATRRMQFFAREGVLAVLVPGTGRSDHGTVLVMGSNANRDAKEPPVPPQIMVATEQYNRLARLVQRNQRVTVELDVRNRFLDDTLDSFNIVAEIPGTDRADEIVMLGAHFDSWHAGTGATDNAAGSAVMMEAMRILKKSGVRLRRTVRLALWTGEEQGLLGSAAYVKRQFADRTTMALTPAHAKLAGYFNMDNGSGAIRGVFLQGNEAVRPVFAAWMEPFRSIGMTTLSIRSTGGTDHLSFDDVGLPGFQFIQDPLEYSSISHHTNMDLFDRLQSEDLMKNAVIIASFVYHAANRDGMLPRKPLPAPRPAPPTQATPAPQTR